MITIYIKPNQFAKNVDENGNIFDFKFETIEKEDGTIEIKDIYLENGFTKVELEDKYFDCNYFDFNEDLTFNVEKYNKRKERENALLILPNKLKRLEELRKDIVQDIAGLYIEDIETRKEEYRTLLNEVRVLQGKTPREIKEI